MAYSDELPIIAGVGITQTQVENGLDVMFQKPSESPDPAYTEENVLPILQAYKLRFKNVNGVKDLVYSTGLKLHQVEAVIAECKKATAIYLAKQEVPE